MSYEISEADWERAASKKNSVSLARDFGDERLYVPTVSPLHVTREEALAAADATRPKPVVTKEMHIAFLLARDNCIRQHNGNTYDCCSQNGLKAALREMES